jgi:hypothetical protein
MDATTENNHHHISETVTPNHDPLAAELDEMVGSDANQSTCSFTENSDCSEERPSYLELIQINGKYDLME